MRIHPLLSLCCLLGIASVSAQVPAVATAEPPPSGCTFRNFAGVCQGFGRADALRGFVGWERDDVSWSHFEPRRGEWNQARLEEWGRKVLALRAKGIELLPILDYCAPWAADMTPRTLHYADGRRVEFKPAPGGGAAVVTTSRQDARGEWVVESEKTVKAHPLFQLGAAFVPEWEAYVRRVVTYLSAPPYNVKYFQIWNEAHPDSGFWRYGDSLDPYMERVHLPAAKIIHGLGGKVVYGGWPCCGSLHDLVALLDRHDAWKTIDVLDIHYFPVSAFEYLDRAARKRGLGDLALWQTEIGFTTNPSAIGNEYPRFLDWCLRHDWNRPDKYKLFWFSASSPDDPKAYGYKCGLLLGDKLSAHGLSLRTLAGLLSPGELGSYRQPVETAPMLRSEPDARRSSLEAFTVGDKKIVLAAHLVAGNDAAIFTDWNGDLDSLHLAEGVPLLSVSLPGVEAARVASVRRVDLAGTELPLTPAAGKTLALEVPIRDAKDSPCAKWLQASGVRTFFIVIDLK